MKNLNLLILVAAVAMTISCAGPKADTNTESAPLVTGTGTPYIPGSVGAGLDPGSVFGGTGTVTHDGPEIFGKYTGRLMNAPTDVKLNLNMVKTSGGTFGGTATITYTDNGVAYKGYFTAGHTAEATKFNVTLDLNGKKTWHALFEDFMGGVVIVIDDVVDLGDGGVQNTVGGSIWFKNYGLTYAPHPPTYCWFVSLGPYDCRAWPLGKSQVSSASTEPLPSSGYQRLGRFTGMDLKKAFNNDSF